LASACLEKLGSHGQVKVKVTAVTIAATAVAHMALKQLKQR
jgi:hypothetical protein